jgi:hypothetical protein
VRVWREEYDDEVEAADPLGISLFWAALLTAEQWVEVNLAGARDAGSDVSTDIARRVAVDRLGGRGGLRRGRDKLAC